MAKHARVRQGLLHMHHPAASQSRDTVWVWIGGLVEAVWAGWGLVFSTAASSWVLPWFWAVVLRYLLQWYRSCSQLRRFLYTRSRCTAGDWRTSSRGSAVCRHDQLWGWSSRSV